MPLSWIHCIYIKYNIGHPYHFIFFFNNVRSRFEYSGMFGKNGLRIDRYWNSDIKVELSPTLFPTWDFPSASLLSLALCSINSCVIKQNKTVDA